MDSIVINTPGVKKIKIERDGEDVGFIKFDPSSVDFAQRFKRLLDELNEKTEENEAKAAALESVTGLDADGIPVNLGQRIDFLAESCIYMRGRLDYVFGEGTSAIAFGDSLRFDVFSQFLEGITPFIESALIEHNEANKARDAKIEKYVTRKPKPKRNPR